MYEYFDATSGESQESQNIIFLLLQEEVTQNTLSCEQDFEGQVNFKANFKYYYVYADFVSNTK